MSHALLEVDGLLKRYGGRTALAGVSLVVDEGEAVGVIGPNGSGKSTLLNVISRLVEPDAGAVRFAGNSLLAVPAWKLAPTGITRMFQAPRINGHLTVFENVTLGLYWATGLRQRLLSPAAGDLSPRDRAKIQDLLVGVGLAGREDEGVETLSHFEIRCMELARALVSSPRLILLDEPTAGFSREERVAFLRLLQSARNPRTSIILIEHNFELIVEICERVVVLDAGALVASGAPAVVRSDPAVLDLYFGGGDA
jgi:ABC-type branched-subunit amino acid transport system ATPase component